MSMKKFLATIMVVALVAVSLTGCMMPQQQLDEDGEPQELRVETIASPPYEKPASPEADQVDIIHERLYILEASYFPAAIYLAEVENVGTEVVAFEAEKIEILTESDAVVATLDDIFNQGPPVLAPGDTGFVTTMMKLSDHPVESIDDMKGVKLYYTASLTDLQPTDTSQYEMSELEFVSEEITFTGVVTNHSDERVTIPFFLLLRDTEGQILIAEQGEVKNVKPGNEAKFAVEATVVDAASTYEEYTVEYLFY